jgi:tripartite-type tricarboxylate transporter receptor subunit TctC
MVRLPSTEPPPAQPAAGNRGGRGHRGDRSDRNRSRPSPSRPNRPNRHRFPRPPAADPPGAAHANRAKPPRALKTKDARAAFHAHRSLCARARPAPSYGVVRNHRAFVKRAAEAAPDGYTLFFAASPLIAVLPKVQKVNYDPHKDFMPVSVFGTGPFILAISSAVAARTIPEFVAYAKIHQINYGSGGTGSLGHLSGALFLARAGLDAIHIPYRGGGPAMTALLGGQVDMYFGNAADIIPQAESGKVRILGVATPTRIKQLPDVPTVGETYPDFSLSSWNGFLVPARTPRAIVDKLAAEVIAAARDPAVVAQLEKFGIEPNGTTPEEFAAQIAREQPQFDAAFRAAKLGGR